MSAFVSPIREPLITGNKSYHDITEDICSPTERAPGLMWIIAFVCAVSCLAFGAVAMLWTIWFGIGSWDLNRTVGWGWDITNFVWWIGIGHAGTLISAILLLFRQKWRTGVNRAAEAMTIFAVMCAAIFPGIHMGRIWLAFFIFPYPNTRGPLWVNFNSPLLWDVFAISTYFTVSLLFWYTGLVPDLATLRDRATGFRKKIYGFVSFGWTGSAKHWQRFESLSLILAGLATPLVLSVHTIVSFDFATSVIPGWHTTIFPPYFVAGAIFSGFAMVLTLMIITRKVLHLEDYITIAHIESMNKVILLTGTIVGTAYISELVIAWYSGYVYEQFAFYNRAMGPYWWSYFGMMFCNVLSPQIFWVRKYRRSIFVTFLMSIFVNIGMWFERFVIIGTTLARDYLPSSWSYYVPTWVEIGIFIGTIGLFFVLYLIFTRVAPVVAIAEVKSILKTAGDQYTGPNAIHAHHGPSGGGHGGGVDLDPSLPEHDLDTRKIHTGTTTSGTTNLVDNKTVETKMSTPIITPPVPEAKIETPPASDIVLETPSVPEAKVDTPKIQETAYPTTENVEKSAPLSVEDDLTKVEGIGPKIQGLLKAEGIMTWAQLSETSVERVKEILVAAGPRYASKIPTTWPMQAGMAARGEWEELEKWQDLSDGGRPIE